MQSLNLLAEGNPAPVSQDAGESSASFWAYQVEGKRRYLFTWSDEVRRQALVLLRTSNLLLGSKLQPEQRILADTNRRAAEWLLERASNVVDYARLDAGEIQLQELTFDPNIAIREVIDAMRGEARGQGVELHAEIAWRAGSLIVGDPGRLKQLLRNLISGAIQRSSESLEQSSVVVRVSRIPDDHSETVRFEIRDEGAPFPREFRDWMKRPPQVGLEGLVFGEPGVLIDIARRVAQLMGGAVRLTEDTWTGANCIQAEIPLRPVCKLPGAWNAPVAQLSGQEALAFVGDPSLRARLDLRLTVSNMRIHWVESGEKLLSAAQGSNAACVFLQYEADASALLLAQQIRAIRPNLPVVIVSAAGEKGQALEAQKAGCWAYLTLPLRQRDLEDCLLLLDRRVKNGGMAGRQIITRFTLEEELRASR